MGLSLFRHCFEDEGGAIVCRPGQQAALGLLGGLGVCWMAVGVCCAVRDHGGWGMRTTGWMASDLYGEDVRSLASIAAKSITVKAI